jgi:hypothetical protein
VKEREVELGHAKARDAALKDRGGGLSGSGMGKGCEHAPVSVMLQYFNAGRGTAAHLHGFQTLVVAEIIRRDFAG